MERIKNLSILGKIGVAFGIVFFTCCGCMSLIPPAEDSLNSALVEEVSALPTQEEEPVVELKETEELTVEVTDEPVVVSTDEPTVAPTDEPTVAPTDEPTVAPTDEPTVAPTDEPTEIPTFTVNVVSNSANLRNGPGGNYDAIDTATNGDSFKVLAISRDGAWYNIELPSGERAWISISLTDGVDTEMLELIAVAMTIPAPPTVLPTIAVVNSPTPTQFPTPTQLATPTQGPQPTQAPQATEAPQPTQAPVQVCSCSSNLYNCSDFGPQSEAQACFNYCWEQGRGDIHDLDRDNDGIACENN